MSSGLTTLYRDFDIFSSLVEDLHAALLGHPAAIFLLDLFVVIELAGGVAVRRPVDHALVEQPLERLLASSTRPRSKSTLCQKRRRGGAAWHARRRRRRGRRASSSCSSAGSQAAVVAMRRDEAQVVPARTGPLRHGVGLAQRRLAGLGIGGAHPVLGAGQRWPAVRGRPVVVERRQLDGQGGRRQRLHRAVCRARRSGTARPSSAGARTTSRAGDIARRPDRGPWLRDAR